MIDKSIPYQILYRFIYKEDIAFGITLKNNNKVENYYFSEWNESIDFDFTGITLEKVYQKIVKAFIKNDVLSERPFDELINRDSRIKALEKELAQLLIKMKNEKQFNRQIEIHKVLLEKEAELKQIREDGN